MLVRQPAADPSPFEVLDVLGSGLFGDVLRVRDRRTGEVVAMKKLKLEDPAELLLFKQEFRLLGNLAHPNVVQLLELHGRQDPAFFTMELVRGVHVDVALSGESVGTEARGEHVARLAAQMVDGLTAIHEQGFVHGDLKPANMMVDEDDRLVLLDLGLARPLRPSPWRTFDAGVGGSPRFMAPELLVPTRPGDLVAPASDWYAIGLVLWELLAGRPLVDVSDPSWVLARLERDAPSIADVVDGVPAALAAVVDGLLRRAPEDRLTAADLRAALVAWSAQGPAAGRSGAVPFVGRRDVRDELAGWLGDLADGRGMFGVVEGPSGVGKTRLVEAVLAEERREGRHRVLVGRCHPGENAPFRAVDGIIGDLPFLLRGHDPQARVAVADGRSALASFPALEDVLDLDDAGPLPADPTEVRRRAFRAIGDLLAHAARDEPILLWIDDVQWADRDSVDLLRRALPRAGDRVGFLATTRPHDRERHADAVATLLLGVSGRPVRRIVLEPLSASDAAELAQAATGRAVPAEQLRLAGGMPIHLVEALQGTRDGGGPVLADLSPGVVLAPVLAACGPDAMEVLTRLAAVGVPLSRRHVLAMFGEPAADALRELRRLGLVHSGGERDDLAVGTRHDFVRRAVLAAMTDDELAAAHLDAASALRRAGASPLLVVEQLAKAGELQTGLDDARHAADRARDVLAFDLEVRLRAWILESDPQATVDDHVAHAVALSRSGALTASGDAWRRAASFADASGDDLQRMDHRRRAAEQYLRSGEVSRGRREMDDLLASLAVRVPATATRALWTVLWRRIRMLFRGLELHDDRHRLLEDRFHTVRMDALWSAATSLAMIDHVVADVLCVQHLRLALDAGEPRRALKALGYEAVFLGRISAPFVQRRAMALAERVQGMAAETGEPYERAWASMSMGTVHWLADRWRPSADALHEALEIWETSCTGVHFERASTCAFLGSAWWHLGDLTALRDVVERMEHEVLDLHNRWPLDAGAFDLLSLVCLLDDDVTGARWWIDEAWRLVPETEHRAARFTHGHTLARVHLYEGDLEAAWRAVEDGWVHVLAANVQWVEPVRVDLRYRRGATAAMLLSTPGRAGDAALVEEVRDDIRDLRASSLSVSPPWAACLESAVARLEGDVASAAASLREAEAAFLAGDMALYAEAARLEHARVVGDAGAEATARRAIAARGVTDVDALQRTMIPVVG